MHVPACLLCVGPADDRAVTPTTWFIYVALYGKDRAPEVCR